MTVDDGEFPGLSELEALERNRPGTLSEEDYVKLMLGYLHSRCMMDVKFLSKRLPDGLKSSPILGALVEVTKCLKEKNFARANLLIASMTGPDSVTPLVAIVQRRIQLFSLEHIRRVYNTITLDRFAAIMGSHDLPYVISQITELGLEYDPVSRMVNVGAMVMEAESVLEDETWSPDLDSLEQISDTVWALGKTPVIIADAVKNVD